MITLSQDIDPGLIDACGETDRSFICRQVYDWTGNEAVATAADWFLDRPIRILIVLIVAWIVSRIAKRAIVRFAKSIGAAPTDSPLRALRELGPGGEEMQREENTRAMARAETLGHVLRSVVLVVIWTFAALIVLGEIGVNLGPLIAGAGIAGIALGFGAQSAVKDFLSGLFMLIEDNYGVGDVIDFGEATGTVEKVSLRSTTLRDKHGTVWHVPNGQINRVANYSQLWSVALLEVEVAYDTDLRRAMSVMQRVADEMWEDPEWGGDELAETPRVLGVQNLGDSGIALRVVVKTEPSVQWSVERELRLRIKEAFDAAAIEIPFPQRTLWLRTEEDRGEGDLPNRIITDRHFQGTPKVKGNTADD